MIIGDSTTCKIAKQQNLLNLENSQYMVVHNLCEPEQFPYSMILVSCLVQAVVVDNIS